MQTNSTMDPLAHESLFVGFDPGLDIVVFAVMQATNDAPVILEAGVIRTQAGELPQRLLQIHSQVLQLLQQYQPRAVAIEELYSHYAHPRTAILMGHARGVILLASQLCQVATHSYAATQIKKTLTGHGQAPKEQMQHAIQREFNLPQLPEPPDVADALAVALCHYYTHRPHWKDALVG